MKQTLINLGFIVKMKGGKIIKRPELMDYMVGCGVEMMDEYNSGESFAYVPTWIDFAKATPSKKYMDVLKGDRDYCVFTSQPLTPSDFEPWEDGKRLEKPNGYHTEHYADLHVSNQKKWLKYQQALLRVKFFLPEGHTVESICKYPTVREAVESGIRLIII